MAMGVSEIGSSATRRTAARSFDESTCATSPKKVNASTRSLLRQLLQGEKSMKTLTGAILIAAFVTPALAADEFYVVQDTATKKCTIVDKKPTTTTTVTQ